MLCHSERGGTMPYNTPRGEVVEIDTTSCMRIFVIVIDSLASRVTLRYVIYLVNCSFCPDTLMLPRVSDLLMLTKAIVPGNFSLDAITMSSANHCVHIPWSFNDLMRSSTTKLHISDDNTPLRTPCSGLHSDTCIQHLDMDNAED
ncbi:hypothetical protein Trydic_g16472 [Trypoxylus dichotomus]